jgi:hypothetical protein
MVIEIDDSGKIFKIDEYYNRVREDGIPKESYTVLKGAGLKAEL